MKPILSRFQSLVLSGCLAASLLVAAPESAVAAPPSATYQSYSHAGTTSHYHVYSQGIDWDRPVGVVFYLDGDYWYNSQSKVHNPHHNSHLLRMADEALSKNMLFVPVISPDQYAGGNGITWWEDVDRNGDWFRAFAQHFISSKGIDRSRVWTIGHSGGAEFETFELGADRQTSWRSGGGSIMVGGGNSRGMQTWPDASAKSMSYQWWVGRQDGEGATWPVTWSAWAAAHAGYNSYAQAGYGRIRMSYVPGNHHQYDFPSILRDSLNHAGVQRPDYILQGGIGAYYHSTGGKARYGSPTSKEWNVYKGGVVQKFHNDQGRVHAIYWSEATGARPVYENGAIGIKYAQNGWEQGWGFPTTEERGFWHGAKQHFYDPATRAATVVYWSEATGAHTMNERGAIFAHWAAGGDVRGYGFPLTDDIYDPAAQTASVRFSGGITMLWDARTGAIREVAS